MEITAKVLQVLPLQSGQGAKGEWKKQEVVFDQGGQYPRKLVVSFWGALANTVFTVGNTMNISIDVESREFNGKWYTDVKAWKILSDGVAPEQQQSQSNGQQPKYANAAEVKSAAIVNGNKLAEETSDLPFVWSIPLIPTGIGLLTAASLFA